MLKSNREWILANRNKSLETLIVSFGCVGITLVTLGIIRDFVLDNSSFLGMMLKLYGPDQTLANWYQPVALAACALLLFLVAYEVSGRHQARWLILAALFITMSIDDSVNVHSLVLGPLDAEIGEWGVVLALLIPTAILSIYLAPMLRDMSKREAFSFSVCAVVFIMGAIVLEAVAGPLVAESAETIGMVGTLWTLSRFRHEHERFRDL